MKKSILLRNYVGSAEMVVAHAAWQRSRGRRPSMSFVGIHNPKRALTFAVSVIDSAKWNKLAHSLVPEIIGNRTYYDMTDLEIKIAAEHIVRTSSSEDEAQKRISEELRYPFGNIQLDIKIPDNAVDREARELVRALGGLIMKNGAMAMAMMHGHDGIIFL